MNYDTKYPSIPSLTESVVNDTHCYIDNLFSCSWQRLKMSHHCNVAGMVKRSGVKAHEVVFLLLLWRWLNVSSIAMFCRDAMQSFSQASKDVLYDLLNNDNMNWRKLNLGAAYEVYQASPMPECEHKAFVLDDSIKSRRGRKMEGVSSHFDHVSGRHVMGQQVLQLGITSEDA